MQFESKLRVGLILAAMVVASTAVNIGLALQSGRLAVVPLYDDVVYLNDAYSRLAFGTGATIWDWAVSFAANPPHSPLSTLTAMIGYSLAGPFVVGPYLANIWILAVYTAAIYLIARRSLDDKASLLVAAIFLFVPAAHAMVNEFRPDMAGGLLMGLSLYLILTTRWEDMASAKRAMLGLLAGIAVTAKPSAVIITIPLIGLASVIGMAQAVYYGGSLSRAIRALYLPLLMFLLVIVPFGLIWGAQIVSYVTQALFTNADIWSTPGDFVFHWTYHSFGEGGRLGLGPFLQAGLVAIAIDAIVSIRTWRERSSVSALSYYAILVIIYLGMSIHSQKTSFQGSFFYVPFAIGVAMALTCRLGWVSGRVNSRKAVAWLLTATLVAVGIFLPPATLFTNTAYFAGTLALRDRVVDEIEKRMAERFIEECSDRRLGFASLSPNPLNPEAVALAVAAKSGGRIDASELYFQRSAESLMNAALASDFVLLPGKAHFNSASMPSFAYIDEVAARLRSSGDWSKVPMPRAMGDSSTLLVKKEC